MMFEEWWARNGGAMKDFVYGHGAERYLNCWNAAQTAERERHEAEVRGLVAKWRDGILKLKAGVEDSPSHDLKRMIKERAEAFTICTEELEALLRPHVSGELRRE